MLSGVQGVRCTPKEEAALASAIQRRLLVRITPALTLDEIRQVTNSDVSTSIVYLTQRIKEFAFQVSQVTAQMGLAVPVSDEQFDGICTGLGLRQPRGAVGDLTRYSHKFPEEIGLAHTTSILHAYMEIVANISPHELAPAREEARLLFRSFLTPYLARLHKEGSFMSTIAVMNSDLLGSSVVDTKSTDDRQAGHTANAIYSAHLLQYPALCQTINRKALTPTTLEVKTVEEYDSRAEMIVRTFQFFLRYFLYTRHLFAKWDSWLNQLHEAHTRLEDEYDIFPPEFLEEFKSDIYWDFVAIVCISGKVWLHKQLSQAEIEDAVKDGFEVALISTTQVLSGVQIPIGEDVFRNDTSLSIMMRNMCNDQMNTEKLERILPRLMNMVYADYQGALYDGTHILVSLFDKLFEWNQHYIIRRLYHTSEAVIQMHLDEEEAREAEEANLLEILMMSKTRFHLTSPASLRRVTLQAPSEEVCPQHTMVEFLAQLRSDIQDLLYRSYPSRNTGLLSSAEPHQYAMWHAVSYSRIHPDSSEKPPASYVLGNSSGYLSRVILELWPSNHVVHLSQDMRLINGRYTAVLGDTSSLVPPELCLIQQATGSEERLTLAHGANGDLTSLTAYGSRELSRAFAKYKARVIYLDFTTTDASNQEGIIRNVIRSFNVSANSAAPIIVLWALTNIDLQSLLRFISCGTEFAWEIVGPEYMTTPILIFAVKPTDITALSAKNLNIHMALRTAMLGLLQQTELKMESYQQLAFEQLIASLSMCDGYRVAGTVTLSGVLEHVSEVCMCQYNQRLDEVLRPTLNSLFLRHSALMHGSERPSEEWVNELRIISDLFTHLGFSIGISSWLEQDLQTIVFNTLNEYLQVLFPEMYANQPAIWSTPVPIVLDGLTTHGHSLIINDASCILGYKHHRIDVLHRINIGLSQSFDLMLARYYVLSQPPGNQESQDLTLSTIHKGLKLNTCCRGNQPGDLKITLQAYKLQLQTWKIVSLQNRYWNPPSLPEGDNVALLTPSPVRPIGSSPRYDAVSPDWRAMATSQQQPGPSHTRAPDTSSELSYETDSD